MDGIPNASTSIQEECAMKEEPPHKTPINKMETFAQKLPPKEKDPRSFILPCIIGNTTVSNALADLGASISVNTISMFKRLGLRNPRPVNMVIEMADRSMQSPKGMVENVLVKIHKFIFLVDFVILDIIEYKKFLIILGRPMLSTTHARIDVFRGKISLEVGKEQIIFNAMKELHLTMKLPPEQTCYEDNEDSELPFLSPNSSLDLRQAVVLFEPGMLDFHELVLMDDLVPSVIIGTVIYSSTPLMSELEIEFPDLCGEVLVIVHLDHWNPRPVNMVIEMADRSMQSPKRMVENVLVKIHLEDLLMDDDINGDLGNFLQDNDLLPDYEDLGATFLSPNKSPGRN
ncbi:retrovirus-related pol polyprotein from transposon TNT 1-94 [Tanacetum coccineum]